MWPRFNPEREPAPYHLHHPLFLEKFMNPKYLFSGLTAVLALAACAVSSAGPWPEPVARSSTSPAPWPPAWPNTPEPQTDFTPPRFEAPTAANCQRAPTTREVPGEQLQQQGASGRRYKHEGEFARDEAVAEARGSARSDTAAKLAPLPAPMSSAAPAINAMRDSVARQAPNPEAAQPTLRSSQTAVVTAGVVDDNADFGEYLAYRQRNSHQPVRDRDISERYLLEVTDAGGRPVHDAEVAVQRPGVAAPVMWARTDTAGRVWLHPRAFMTSDLNNERTLGVAVRKGSAQARATLLRGQTQAVQVRLGGQSKAQRPRLDLVFMVDATGSMGDEIGKLKASMRAMADQMAQLPGQPDICYGLVAYRDRGDAFITRTHDFTNDLSAFQNLLSRVQAQGGGDTPEALNEALHEVVHSLSWRTAAARLVVLVADAPPHLDYGGPQYDSDMQAALAKGIKLFAVGASGLDPVGEYVFRQMAQYTAGRFVFLTYKDAANPASGPGTQTVHDVKNYSVQTLDKLVVRLVSEEMARLVKS
jgi:Mg-chelatase subunit ChlD